MNKPTDRVTTLEKQGKEMLSARGQVVPAKKADRRLFTLREAHTAIQELKKKPAPQEGRPRVVEVSSDGVVKGSAQDSQEAIAKAEPEPIDKFEPDGKPKPEPIEVIKRPMAIFRNHKGVDTEHENVPDYTVN